MITAPSMPQLLETIRDELADKVLPEVDDAATKVTVEMIMAVLNQLVARSENEIAWMLEECAAIEAAADRLLSSLPDTSPLGEALTTFRANRAETMHLSAVAADYGRCSEVLSRLAEGAYAAGDDDAIATVQELIDGRLATEQAAIGEFIAVGRD